VRGRNLLRTDDSKVPRLGENRHSSQPPPLTLGRNKSQNLWLPHRGRPLPSLPKWRGRGECGRTPASPRPVDIPDKPSSDQGARKSHPCEVSGEASEVASPGPWLRLP